MQIQHWKAQQSNLFSKSLTRPSIRDCKRGYRQKQSCKSGGEEVPGVVRATPDLMEGCWGTKENGASLVFASDTFSSRPAVQNLLRLEIMQVVLCEKHGAGDPSPGYTHPTLPGLGAKVSPVSNAAASASAHAPEIRLAPRASEGDGSNRDTQAAPTISPVNDAAPLISPVAHEATVPATLPGTAEGLATFQGSGSLAAADLPSDPHHTPA